MSTPYCRAFMTCETIVCDQFTDKWSLVNVFSTVWANEFPVMIPRLSCYAVVYDCGGIINGQFRLLDPELNVVRDLVVPPLATERREENEFGGVFPEVVLPRPGRYSVEFLVDGKVLQTSRLDARSVPAA